MSNQACKVAVCAGSCLYTIVDDQTRELTEVIVKLAAANQLDEDELADVIDTFTRYEREVERRLKVDNELKLKLKAILDL